MRDLFLYSVFDNCTGLVHDYWNARRELFFFFFQEPTVASQVEETSTNDSEKSPINYSLDDNNKTPSNSPPPNNNSPSNQNTPPVSTPPTSMNSPADTSASTNASPPKNSFAHSPNDGSHLTSSAPIPTGADSDSDIEEVDPLEIDIPQHVALSYSNKSLSTATTIYGGETTTNPQVLTTDETSHFYNHGYNPGITESLPVDTSSLSLAHTTIATPIMQSTDPKLLPYSVYTIQQQPQPHLLGATVTIPPTITYQTTIPPANSFEPIPITTLSAHHVGFNPINTIATVPPISYAVNCENQQDFNTALTHR